MFTEIFRDLPLALEELGTSTQSGKGRGGAMGKSKAAIYMAHKSRAV